MAYVERIGTTTSPWPPIMGPETVYGIKLDDAIMHACAAQGAESVIFRSSKPTMPTLEATDTTCGNGTTLEDTSQRGTRTTEILVRPPMDMVAARFVVREVLRFQEEAARQLLQQDPPVDLARYDRFVADPTLA